MRTMHVKSDNSKAIEQFLASGGVIQVIPPVKKEKKTREVRVVEIDVEALPKELLKFLPEAA